MKRKLGRHGNGVPVAEKLPRIEAAITEFGFTADDARKMAAEMREMQRAERGLLDQRVDGMTVRDLLKALRQAQRIQGRPVR